MPKENAPAMLLVLLGRGTLAEREEKVINGIHGQKKLLLVITFNQSHSFTGNRNAIKG